MSARPEAVVGKAGMSGATREKPGAVNLPQTACQTGHSLQHTDLFAGLL